MAADMGCAAGRFSLELSTLNDFVIDIDSSKISFRILGHRSKI